MAGSESAALWRGPVARLAATLAVEPTAWWILASERMILAAGEPATEREQGIAADLGVRDPARVRFLRCAEIPVPGRRWANWFARATPGPIGGLTARYGIFLHPTYWENEEVRIHELVHVAQYDRLGTRPFLWRYLYECLTDGYLDSPLEQEARTGAARWVEGG